VGVGGAGAAGAGADAPRPAQRTGSDSPAPGAPASDDAVTRPRSDGDRAAGVVAPVPSDPTNERTASGSATRELPRGTSGGAATTSDGRARRAVAVQVARADLADAQARAEKAREAVRTAGSPAARSQAQRRLESARSQAARATDELRAAQAEPDPRRSGEAAPAPVAPPTIMPEELDLSIAATRERAGQALSYVEDVVPGRSTGLLVALVGGIVALLLLIGREWLR
jgi:hypothetical protein